MKRNHFAVITLLRDNFQNRSTTPWVQRNQHQY